MSGDAVMHVVERWLPVSETFVHDLVRTVRRPGVVVSRRPVEHRDRFPVDRLVRVGGGVDRLPAPWRRRVVTAALLALAARHRVGMIHVHHGYRAYEVVGAARRGRLPFVVSLHGHDATGHLARRPDAYAGAFERSAAIVVPSRFLADRALAAGAPADRLHVIPSGVDTRWFSPTPLPARPEVVFVGRFVAKKGVDVLLAAWPAVRAAVPGVRLRLLGTGPAPPVSRGGPLAPGQRDIEVVADPDRTAVRDAMRRGRVVVSPSRTPDDAAADDAVESLLLVNLEAQASGRPVVTTAHGGIPEYVRAGETALVVPEGDADALGAALIAVLTDDSLAARLAAAGPAWAARFDLSRTAGLVDDLYDRVARRTVAAFTP